MCKLIQELEKIGGELIPKLAGRVQIDPNGSSKS
jgi:hypothetical protein